MMNTNNFLSEAQQELLNSFCGSSFYNPINDVDHHARYNRLMYVREAHDRLVEKADFLDVINSLGRVITRLGMQDQFMIKLLHRHTTLSSGEFMMERLESLDGGRPALSTVREASAKMSSQFCVSVWRCLEGGQIEPLEFGRVSLYGVEGDLHKKHTILFEEFFETAREYGVQDILGISLKPRVIDFDRMTQTLVEITDDREANVLTVHDKSEFEPGYLVETTWDFSTAESQSCTTCWANCHPQGVGHDQRHGKTMNTH